MATGVSKKYEVSDDLADFLGSSAKVTRGAVVKAIWAYASDEDLKTQKKYKGRNMGAVESDDVLEPIIGRGVVAAPEIMKKISDHLFSDT